MAGNTEALVIGGGFYGAAIAVYLASQKKFKKIILVEKEKELLRRASYINQARVHGGYHYPRSYTTAFRSRVNMPRFLAQWPEAIEGNFKKIYAISKFNSKTSARQFERFCHSVGAKIDPIDSALNRLFDKRLIQAAYQVQEFAFNADKLRSWANEELSKYAVDVRLSSRIVSISAKTEHGFFVTIENKNKNTQEIRSQYVFNCTYSGLRQLGESPHFLKTKIKHEITELILLKSPDDLINLGVTVIDGPFFSIMPFPAQNLHSLSHVRYTPHVSWNDSPGINPYEELNNYSKHSRFERMIRDASRYIPVISNSKFAQSLFEIKTVLQKNEIDDGRPILFEKNHENPGFFSILGSKIDNIFDILELIENENFKI